MAALAVPFACAGLLCDLSDKEGPVCACAGYCVLTVWRNSVPYRRSSGGASFNRAAPVCGCAGCAGLREPSGFEVLGVGMGGGDPVRGRGALLAGLDQ